jgi:hypothetical protein
MSSAYTVFILFFETISTLITKKFFDEQFAVKNIKNTAGIKHYKTSPF